MRFLIPVILLVLTAIYVPRQTPEEPVAMAVGEAYAEGRTEAGITEEAAGYDEVIESSGMLNRLELLDF